MQIGIRNSQPFAPLFFVALAQFRLLVQPTDYELIERVTDHADFGSAPIGFTKILKALG